ncbi:O-antigen ligase family protein [Desulfosporosinus sp. SYSU MS00001]|uniref:O-antigen ligase family protein n=1 Tax=Desulfosporosinus sp. SYSU MS00001 TaxID=3416284 RepID=UPI003CF5168F
MAFLGLIFGICIKRKVIVDIVVLSAIGMIIVMLFWNNYTIKDVGIVGMYGLLLPVFFFIVCWRNSDWHIELLTIMMVFGIFYAFWTIICLAYPTIYYQHIASLMQSLYPQISYDINPEAGLTAHYSTNGMYLANGVIATLCKWLLSDKNATKSRKLYIIAISFQAAALLISGKRGPLLCVIIALYVAYFLYHINKPKGRFFKLVLISLLAMIILYLAILIVPALANPFMRMFQMMNTDDVSTGRFDLWAAGWRDFLQSPLIGRGWRWFYYNDTQVFANFDIHNVYLQFLVETGILGSITFYVFIFVNYYRTVKLTKAWRREIFQDGNSINYGILLFCIIYQTYYLIFIFEGTAFFNPEAMFPYIASCAMTQYIYRNSKIRKVDYDALKAKDGRKKIWA